MIRRQTILLLFYFFPIIKTNKKFDEKAIKLLIKESEHIQHNKLKYFQADTNYALYQQLEDFSYLETAFNLIQERADAMEVELKFKFLSYPISKAIIDEREKVK